MLAEVRERCNAIEECYEFMLAFAAQGLPSEEGGKGSQVREFLRNAIKALNGLADVYRAAVKQEGVQSVESFLAVLERDANDSRAAFEMVLAQPTISSQVIDNLNASIHVRALLTDLFLIDEILRPQGVSADPAATT